MTAWRVALPYATQPPSLLLADCPRINGYEFYSLLDSNFGDIGGQRTGKTLQQLAAECSSLPDCQSFNTNGYLKKSVKTLDQFQRLTGDPCHGLYVKQGMPGKTSTIDHSWCCMLQ